VITIGIDPHKSSHTAVALDATGHVLGELRVAATKTLLERLLRWAERWPDRVWAVEGASGLGHFLAQQLVARQETVLDVPATLAARARLLARGHGRKTDGIDASSVARVAQSQSDLRRVGREDHSGVLRLLSDRRDELTQERRTVVNRLHRLLRDLHPGGAPTELSAEAAARLLGRIRPVAVVDLERKAMARALVADLRRVDRALVESRTRCAAAVLASAPPSPASSASATCWRPRSWATPATSVASPRRTTSRATPARHRSRSPAARSPATACPGVATAPSTTRCISPLGSRRCILGPDGLTTSANSPSTSPPARRFGA
jgi:transposase